ncbi:organic cation transporter protein-like [Cherax quadricarinatus]|uniref:organic cation transporter protein-like n=1 Tax=Cherax quadricarinatus TaxID=27406 RepID=UPI00387E7263
MFRQMVSTLLRVCLLTEETVDAMNLQIFRADRAQSPAQIEQLIVEQVRQPVVNERCAVPNCDDNSTHYEENFTEWAIPEGDQCHVWTLRNNITEQCQPDVFSNSTSSCSQWVYDTSLFSATTVTQFDLTCENAWLRPLGGSVYMIGMLVGAVVIGDLADRFGRRKGILVSVLLVGASGVMCSVSPNYYMFLLMRLFTGAGGCGLVLVTYILTLEFIGAKWRTFCGILIQIPLSLGEAMTGVLAIFIRDWRWLQVAITAPAFLLLSYTWLLPESVRWLVAEGRNDEANNIIHRVARVNNVDLPRHLTDLHDVQFGSVDGTLSVTNSNTVDGTMSVTNSNTVDGTLSVTNSNVELVNETRQEAMIKKTVIDLLRTPVMRRRSFTLFFCWVVCALVFYGLSSNTTSLGGNIFVDFISTMLVEIPSLIFTFLVLDR